MKIPEKIQYFLIGIGTPALILMLMSMTIYEPPEPSAAPSDTFYVYLVQTDWGIKTAVRFEASIRPRKKPYHPLVTRTTVYWENLQGKKEELVLRRDDIIYVTPCPDSLFENWRKK